MKNIADIYNPYKILKHADVIDAYKSNNYPIPLKHIMLYPTNDCNHKCWFCTYSDRIANKSDIINLDMVVLCTLISDMNSMNVTHITLTGGEPTVYPNCKKAVDLFGNANVRIGMVTNGENILDVVNSDNIRFFDWIRFSINGSSPSSYAKCHNVNSGTFDKVLRNLSCIANIKDNCALTVNFIFTLTNYYTIFRFVETLKNIGIDGIRFTIPTSLHGNLFNGDTIKKMLFVIQCIKSDFECNNFHVFDAVGNRINSIIHNEQDYKYCYIKDIVTSIDFNGDVYLCCILLGHKNGLIGNISKSGLLKLWLSDKVQSLLRKHNPLETCNNRCMYYERNKTMEYLLGNGLITHDYYL